MCSDNAIFCFTKINLIASKQGMISLDGIIASYICYDINYYSVSINRGPKAKIG